MWVVAIYIVDGIIVHEMLYVSYSRLPSMNILYLSIQTPPPY